MSIYPPEIFIIYINIIRDMSCIVGLLFHFHELMSSFSIFDQLLQHWGPIYNYWKLCPQKIISWYGHYWRSYEVDGCLRLFNHQITARYIHIIFWLLHFTNAIYGMIGVYGSNFIDVNLSIMFLCLAISATNLSIHTLFITVEVMSYKRRSNGSNWSTIGLKGARWSSCRPTVIRCV